MMSEASFASLGPTLLARKGGAKPAMRPQLTPLPEDISGLAALADEQLEDLGWNDMGTDGAPLPVPAPEALAPNTPEPVEWEDADNEAECDPDYDQDYETGFGADNDADNDAGDDEAASGPHPIIDPMTSAQVVPLGLRAKPRPVANRTVINETAGNEVAANEDACDANHDPRQRRQPLLERTRRAFAEPLSPLGRSRGIRKETASAARGKRAAFTLRLDTDRHLKLRLAATMQGVSAQSLVTQALDAMLQDIEALDTLVERMKRD